MAELRKAGRNLNKTVTQNEKLPFLCGSNISMI